jgi:hypothetical protein
MGTVGDAYDNAMAESFFATLECELIDRRSWPTKTEARMALFSYMEGWYNPRAGTAHSGRCRRPTSKGNTSTATACQHREVHTGYPPSAFAWLAPRRRWITLHLCFSLRLENQVPTRPRNRVKSRLNRQQTTPSTLGRDRGKKRLLFAVISECQVIGAEFCGSSGKPRPTAASLLIETVAVKLT